MLNADLEAEISTFRKAVEDCKLLVAECEISDAESRPISPIDDPYFLATPQDRHRDRIASSLDSARVNKCICSVLLTIVWCEGKCREQFLKEESMSRSQLHERLSLTLKEINDRERHKIQESSVSKRHQYDMEVLLVQLENANRERELLLSKMRLLETSEKQLDSDDQFGTQTALTDELQRELDTTKYELFLSKERCQFLEMSFNAHVQNETDSLERFMNDEVSQLHIRLAEEQIRYQESLAANHLLMSRIDHIEALLKEAQSESSSLKVQIQFDKRREDSIGRNDLWMLNQLQVDDMADVQDNGPSLMMMLDELKEKYDRSEEMHSIHQAKLLELEERVHQESTLSKTWHGKYIDLQKKFDLYHPELGAEDTYGEGRMGLGKVDTSLRPNISKGPKRYTSLVDPHMSAPPTKIFLPPEETRAVSPNVGKDLSPTADAMRSPVRVTSPSPIPSASPHGKIFIHTRPPKPNTKLIGGSAVSRRCGSPPTFSLPRSTSLTQHLSQRSYSASKGPAARAASPSVCMGRQKTGGCRTLTTLKGEDIDRSGHVWR